MEIPTYESSLEYIDVEEPYRKVWRRNGIFRLFAHNATNTKRNYSMASNPESEKEIVYIGGGAGMAPLRSHISYLFESLKTKRQVSYWYGARSIKELFYTDYFEKLAEEYRNFRFYTALSEPQPGDKWDIPV